LYVRGVCGKRLGKAEASEFKVSHDIHGNTRFKVHYDKAWGKYEINVVRRSTKEL
jgi:hypothetical protein